MGPDQRLVCAKSGFALAGFWQAGLPIRDSGAPRNFLGFLFRTLESFFLFTENTYAPNGRANKVISHDDLVGGGLDLLKV